MFDMAEGVEETENNNNNSGEKIVMLGAVMPCEMSGPNLGGLKRELEIIPATGATAITSPGATTPTIQQHPINLKSEEIERDNESPSNSPARPISRCSNSDIYSNIRDRCERMHSQSPSPPPQSLLQHHHHHQDSKNAVAAASAAAAQAHFNGTMQGILNLQKLQQNIASMTQPVQQQQSPQMPSMPGMSALNSPLNLSVGGGPSLGGQSGLLGGLNLNTNQMPQLILASGQLVQGIQGAQLLIPTSQGIATQTILTIPVSQQVNANEQLVQSLAAMNGIGGSPGAAAANNNNNNLVNQGASGILSPHLLATSVQQLLSAINPVQQQTLNPSQTLPTIPGSPPLGALGGHHSRVQTPKSSPPRIASASSISSVGSSHHHELNPPIIQSTCLSTTSSSSSSSLSSTMSQRHHPYEKNNATTTTSTTTLHSQSQTPNYSMNGHSQLASSPNHLHHRLHHASDHHHSHHHNMSSHQTSPSIPLSQQNLSSRGHSPTSLAISNINRLTSTNGELTITKSHGPSPSLGSSSSSSSHPSGNVHMVPQIKLSPSSMKMSPSGSESSRNDLLDDNPNEPTINQTNVNVVDGIDLDEIKEFAKAFKLRRLSLGLTQTQVGQALSVTEGPAYSQSAICSALAAQMYAAQLSSQQQAMFEKLDITPKSAQKIKPVLERWMKEAEERYKSGQNHLTEFIGVEPSKKRKRRTSFTPQALELLNAHFERNTHPSGTEITGLAHQLGYEREVIRIWFCNKRQALKNTVRMMSKGMV